MISIEIVSTINTLQDSAIWRLYKGLRVFAAKFEKIGRFFMDVYPGVYGF